MTLYDSFTEKEMQILQARAERVARVSGEGEADDSITGLMVNVHDQTYVIPIDSLTTVYERVSVVPLPSVPPFVAGIANLRGHIIPVLDLAVLLNVPGTTTTDLMMLVVAANREMTVAFHVDRIGDVTNYNRDNLTPVPANFETAQGLYLQGILADGTAVLDVEAILNDPALIVDEVVG